MTTAPELSDLKARPCTLEELQAALVQLIELHNKMQEHLNRLIENGNILSSREAAMNRRYGL